MERTAPHVRAGVVEHGRDGPCGRGALCLEPGKANRADVDGRRPQRRDETVGRRRVERRDARHETLRRDAVDRARQRVVQVLVATHARVDPVAHIQRAVGTDGNVRWAKEGFQRARRRLVATAEVRPRILLLDVRRDEHGSVERESRALAPGLIREDFIASRIRREERPLPLGPERAVLVEDIARWGATAVDVAGRRHARIVLAPFGDGNRLPGPPVHLPRPLAIDRRKPEVRVLHHPAHAAGRRVVVVVLEHVAERGHRLLVGVAIVVADDLDIRAVRVHPRGEPAHIHVAVVAGLAGIDRRVVGKGERTNRAGPVPTEDPERLAGAIGERGAHVARVEDPLAVRTNSHRVQRVVVVDALEARQQHFANVDTGVEPEVAVDVRVDDQVWRLRDNHLVVDDRHAERCDERRLLDERV